MIAQEAVMGSRAAMQALVPGRVVLVTNPGTGLSELGIVCGSLGSGGGRGSALGVSTSSAGGQLLVSSTTSF